MTCARSFWLLLPLLALTASCAARGTVPTGAHHGGPPEFGVLVMAHGGSAEWNGGVLDAVDPLRDRYPLEVAFGMADAVSIQETVRKLEARGVRKIGVVRLFISGESWYERTEQILGLRSGAPAAPDATTAAHEAGHAGHDHSMEFWRVQTEASFALTTRGLAESEAMGTVLADRARALSRHPQREVVLILAHGPGDDSENQRWVAHIDARAETVRQALPFKRVEVMTLREDWPEKREEAERRIRTFVGTAAADGLTAIVIPFRVRGFGPYAQVLGGLEYIADGQGLVPHAQVTEWIANQIEALRQGTFRSVAD